MKRSLKNKMKRILAVVLCCAVLFSTLITATVVSAAETVGQYRTETNTGNMNIIPYNNDSITTDLGVGIFARPAVLDYNKDGYMDLIVQSSNVSYPGTMVFYGSASSSDKTSGNYLLMDKGIYVGAAPAGNNPETTGSYIYDENGNLVNSFILENRVVYPDYSNKANSFTLPNLTLPETIEGHPVGSTLEFDRHTLVDINGDGKLDIVRGICSNAEFQNSGGYNENGEWGLGSTDYGNDGDGDPNHGWVLWAENTSDVAYGSAATYSELMLVMVQHADGTVSVLHTEGNPTPVFWDFDNDGDFDIICCNSTDDVTYFENIGGSATSNLTADGVFLCAEGIAVKKANGNNTENLDDLLVELCLPRIVLFDWDNDGDQDIICGEEDGRVSIMENTGLLASTGAPIFEAQKFFRTPADSLKDGVLNTPFSVDWDGDGDEDIICGNTAGYISFIENVTPAGGDLKNPSWAEPVRLKDANGNVIRIQAGYNGSPQGPPEEKWGYTVVTVADWDGDGILDIMSNDIWGKVRWFKGIEGETYKVDGPYAVEVEWENGVKSPSYYWWKPEGNELATYWRTTALMIDLNEDGLCDLVMSDHEGYMAFYERYEENGELKLKEGKRIFTDPYGNPIVLNTEIKALSGQNRAKIVLVDWDGDGDLDFLRSYGYGYKYFINLSQNRTEFRFKEVGYIHDRHTAGHTSSASVCDWDKNGQPDLIVGTESGHIYYLNRAFANDDPPEIRDSIAISTMKGWGWINHGQGGLKNAVFSEEESSQVASSLVPNAWAGAYSGAHVISSKDGALTGPVAGKEVDSLSLNWMDINVSPISDSAIFYVELPNYNVSNAEWALGVSLIGLKQNDKEYFVNFAGGGKFEYMSVYDGEWKTSSIATDTSNNSYFSGLPSGFKGYIRLNFERFSYNSMDIDFSEGYSFHYITFTFNSLGGGCGDMLFGGIFYMPANNANVALFECNNEYFELTRERDDAIIVGSLKGWGWLTKTTTGFKNAKLISTTNKDQVAAEYVPNAAYEFPGEYVVTSKDGALTGPVAGKDKDTMFMEWLKIPVDPTSDEVIFYVELPDYEKSGATWALAMTGYSVRQNNVAVSANFTNGGKFSYLSVDGDEWVKSTTVGTDRYLDLPSGFKGYIRINFEDNAYWNTVDLNSPYEFYGLNFDFNSLGGECGDVTFGGIFYVPTNNSDATVIEVNAKSYELTKKPIIVNGGKGSAWITHTVSLFKNLNWTRDTSYSQVASSVVPSGSFGGVEVISSKDGTLTGAIAGKEEDLLYLQWLGITVNPNADETIFYVELPDYEKSGATWALGLNGFALAQVGGSDVWANMNNANPFSYLPVDGEDWINSTIDPSTRSFNLPSGFKGYIRLDFESFAYWNPIDLDSDYNFTHITFSFNSIGGECGDLIFGGIFYTPSTKGLGTTFMVGDKSYSLTVKRGDANRDEAIDANDLVDLRKIILGTTATYDHNSADSNADNAINVKDLVNLKKKLAG